MSYTTPAGFNGPPTKPERKHNKVLFVILGVFVALAFCCAGVFGGLYVLGSTVAPPPEKVAQTFGDAMRERDFDKACENVSPDATMLGSRDCHEVMSEATPDEAFKNGDVSYHLVSRENGVARVKMVMLYENEEYEGSIVLVNNEATDGRWMVSSST